MNTNPYQPPTSSSEQPSSHPPSDGDQVPPLVLEMLSQTRPWVKLLGITGFVMCGLMGLLGLALFVASTVSTAFGKEGLIGLVYVPFAFLYIFPSLYLYRYAAAIKQLLLDQSMESLAEALRHQKSFWKLIGVVMAVMLGIYAVFILVLMVVAGVKFATATH